jgi:hypothetical protein
VAFAGDEVLAIRREIRLPESFARQSRSDGQRAIASGGLLALPAIALLIVGMVRSRRRPILANDDLSRRGFLVMLLAFAVTTVASSAQSLPTALAVYDTAVPWGTFVTSVFSAQVMSLVGVFILVAFWLLANGMRRRAGIPLIAGSTPGGASADLAAALILGGIPVVTRSLGRFVQDDSVPFAPQTSLDAVLPLLSRALAVLPDAVGLMLVVSIPALALTMLATRRAIRLAGVAAFLGFMAAASVAFQRTGESDASLVRQGVMLAGGALVLLAIAAFGRVSVLSWVLAALFSVALGNISFALQAPTGLERAGGLLGALLAATLITGGAILSRRATSGRSEFTSPETRGSEA